VRRLVLWVFDRWYRLLLAVILNGVVCSGLYSLKEGKGPIEGLWWGLVSGSTVGYGDQYPVSTLGRAIAAWLIISSVVGVALLTGQVSAWCNRDAWLHEEQEQLKADARASRDAAEAALDEVRALRAELRGDDREPFVGT
jgi:hypothetical protein